MEDAGWQGGAIRLERAGDAHLEALRACFLPDDPVWEIYPVPLHGEHFDTSARAMLANPARLIFAVLLDGEVTGMTSYLNLAPDRQTLEIGGTFMAPRVRGSGLNARVKRLLLGRAFASGVRRVEFRIDERNARSQAAVAKLGAVREGVLRAERVTWTGFVRDTGIWSILAQEWAARG
ncbi:MAG: GNAT family N-acetyltransferase [Sphingomonadales bacterium]|nr:GNAT family N-acetyltransferase [Sphingomonadales bacterium]MDE2570622.1 GNAT family N-acetyltransferase [Sphingomonadales bacterium]